MRRTTDNDEGHWFRSDRFFISDGLWFFSTRENTSFGPFTRFPDANQTLKRYVLTQKTVKHVRGQVSELESDNTFDVQSVGLLAKEFHASKKANAPAQSDELTRNKSTPAVVCRTSDSGHTPHYQSERFFSANQQWYFSTREAPDSGPFESRARAEQELVDFLRIRLGVRVDTWDTPGLA